MPAPLGRAVGHPAKPERLTEGCKKVGRSRNRFPQGLPHALPQGPAKPAERKGETSSYTAASRKRSYRRGALEAPLAEQALFQFLL